MKDRVFAFLRGVDVKINFYHSRQNCGEIEDYRIIRLDPRVDCLSTLIHEALHGLEPDWTEDQVLKREKWLANRLTLNDWKKLLEILNQKVNVIPARKRRR